MAKSRQSNELITRDEASVDDKLTKPGKIDIGIAWKMRFINGVDLTLIGEHFGVSKQAVQQALAHYKDMIPGEAEVGTFVSNFSHILKALDMKLTMSLMDDECINKASLNNRAYTWGTVRNQRLLDDGKATSNIQYSQVNGDVEKLTRDLSKLFKENPELVIMEAE